MNLVTRRWWLLALGGAPVALGLGALSLSVRLDNDYLRINAPNLQFLSGKPLQRLKDGNTVGYVGQLTVTTGAEQFVQARSIARFAISYDIWEERFKVTLATPGLSNRPMAKNLTADAAQSWCLDNLKIDLARVPAGRPIWVRLEMRAEDPKDTNAIIGDGISLNGLIAIFSHPAKSTQTRWLVEAGPLSLSELRKRSSNASPGNPIAALRFTLA